MNAIFRSYVLKILKKYFRFRDIAFSLKMTVQKEKESETTKKTKQTLLDFEQFVRLTFSKFLNSLDLAVIFTQMNISSIEQAIDKYNNKIKYISDICDNMPTSLITSSTSFIDLTRVMNGIDLQSARGLQALYKKKKLIVDMNMLNDFKSQRIINWLRVCLPIYPVITIGSGNCLVSFSFLK